MPSVPNSRRMALVLLALAWGCASAIPDEDDGGGEVASAVGEKLRVAHPSRGAFAPVAASRWATADVAAGRALRRRRGQRPPGRRVLGARDAGSSSRSTRRRPARRRSTTTGWPSGADGIWRAEIASVPGKTLYAFRAWGPNWPFDRGLGARRLLGGLHQRRRRERQPLRPEQGALRPVRARADARQVPPAHDAAPGSTAMYGTGDATTRRPRVRHRAVGAEVGRARRRHRPARKPGIAAAGRGRLRGARARAHRAPVVDEPDRRILAGRPRLRGRRRRARRPAAAPTAPPG